MSKRTQSYSELRIIGGRFRSRLIKFPNTNDIRPTPNRVRETLFNWLAPYIVDARCLDLFAGSGALSFEAVSRGASFCLLFDNDRKVIAALEDNRERLQLTNIEIIQETFPYLKSKVSGLFDIVFLDPPFHQNFISKACNWLLDTGCLSPQALIYLEIESELNELPVPSSWQLLKSKVAGQVRYCLFQV
jgi:16S rRNA (guanine966-N2)-methyltransferase